MWLQYDREELYRKVWEQPMLRVAEQYGVSSVALGKVCRKLSVPIPGRQQRDADSSCPDWWTVIASFLIAERFFRGSIFSGTSLGS